MTPIEEPPNPFDKWCPAGEAACLLWVDDKCDKEHLYFDANGDPHCRPQGEDPWPLKPPCGDCAGITQRLDEIIKRLGWIEGRQKESIT